MPQCHGSQRRITPPALKESCSLTGLREGSHGQSSPAPNARPRRAPTVSLKGRHLDGRTATNFPREGRAATSAGHRQAPAVHPQSSTTLGHSRHWCLVAAGAPAVQAPGPPAGIPPGQCQGVPWGIIRVVPHLSFKMGRPWLSSTSQQTELGMKKIKTNLLKNQYLQNV